VTYDPRTGDSSLLGRVGPVNLKYRLTRLDSAGNVLSSSSWINYAYELAALPTSTFEVRNLRLSNDTGTSATDKVTSDPTLTGNLLDTATPPKSVAYSLVQFDHNGDGLADGNALTDDLGVFEYRPLGLSYTTHTLRVRSAQYDVAFGSYLLGPWSDLSIHYIAPPAPQFSSLALVSDTGVSSTDKITDNPAIVGTLTLDDRPVSDYLVYIDHNGNGSADGTAITDRFGNFVYRPQNLPTGPVTLSLVTSYWDTNLQSTVYSQPTTFQYTYLATPLPSIDWLEIAVDDGDNAFDRHTTSSLLAGQLSTSAVHSGVQIQFDHDGNGTVDGVAISDSFGAIMYRPFGLAPGAVEINARVNHWNADQAQWVTGTWKEVSFVLEASSASAMNVTSLGLRRDTGANSTDKISSEGTIVGQTGHSGSGTSVSISSLSNQRVEFDENSDDVIDGIAFTEADGTFQYTPKSLSAGAKNVRARTRVWNTTTQQGELGAWQTYSYTIAADPVIPAAIQTMGLLSDSGTSASDYITRNAAITGTVALASGQTSALLEVDLDNNGTADFTTNTDADGRFLVYPNFSTFGTKTVAIRTFTFDPNSTARAYSSWQAFSYTYSNLASEPASITNLAWTPATHTTPAKLTGRVLDDAQVSGVNVEIDLNGDNVPEAVVKTDAFGKFEYTYAPSTSSSATQVTLQIRTHQSIDGQAPQTSNWNSHTFSNPAPAALTPPTLGAWGLAVDDGSSATDNASTDMTLKGTVQPGTSRSGIAGQLIQFDHNGDGAPDGSTLTDGEGKFQYTPSDLSVGAHTLKTRMITFDPDLGMITGAWSSISVTQTALVVTKVATLGLVSDTGTTGDGATANVAVQGTITGPAVGNVLIFFDVDGDGSPDGNATTNSVGAFSFTPTTPDNEGFVQVDAWLARGGSPSDSTSRTFRFVYSSAPNGSSAQALVTELASFDTAWQNANTTLEQGLAAAKSALKSSQQTADATYRQEMSTAMSLYQSTRLSTVTAYRDQLRAAEFQLGTSLSAAEAAFLNQTSGQSYGTDPEFVWPITPPEDAFVIPNDADQPAPPKYYGLDAGPTLDIGTHPNALQLAAISDSNAATAKAAALATYNQTVTQAQNVSTAAKAASFQIFASAVSQNRANAAASAAQLKHPTIDVGAESEKLFNAQQSFHDQQNTRIAAAEQVYTAAVQNAMQANQAAVWQAQQDRDAKIQAAWDTYNNNVNSGMSDPGAAQQFAQARDTAIRNAIIECEQKIADAEYTASTTMSLAAKTRTLEIADATYDSRELAAGQAQWLRDAVAQMNYWIRGVKISLQYNQVMADAEAAENRAKKEADAAHALAKAIINAIYAFVSSEADADDQNTKEKSSIAVNLLSPFAGFLDSPAAKWQLTEAQLTKTATDTKSESKKKNTKSKAEEIRDAALKANDEVRDHLYRVAEAQKKAAQDEALEQRKARDAANTARLDLDLDTSLNLYNKEKRAAAADKKHNEDMAVTMHTFNSSYATHYKTKGYSNAPVSADFQLAAPYDLAAQSTYFQGLAASQYTFEVSMATTWRTYRESQADDTYNDIELRAQHEFLNISESETTAHDTREAIVTFVSEYDKMLAVIIASEANTTNSSLAQYNNAALNEWLGMTQANAQHDLDYDNEVADAETEKEVNTTTAKSEQTVATYESFKERMTDFSNSLGDAWGIFNLAKATVEVIFQQLLKAATILRTTQAVAEFLDYWTDYFQKVKDLVTGTASDEKTLVSGVLGEAKDYVNGTNTDLKSLAQEQTDLFKTLQIGLSNAYKGWQIRLAEISRDKKTSDADAQRDYLKSRAQIQEQLEPSYAYARKNLAIAQARFNANQITAGDWATAQSTYASAIAALDAQLVTLTAPFEATKRTAEGEAIRVLTVETAKAEQSWNTNASTALTAWATNSGTKTNDSAGSVATKGETFADNTTTKQKTAIDSVEDKQKSFVDQTTDKEEETAKEVTSIDNSFFLTLAQILGDLLVGKIDARSAYESLLADNHKTKKEANHQAAPSALTDLQRSVATADSAKYATRKTANQQKAQASKSESVSLTTKLNTADQGYVDGVSAKENTTTSGFADKGAAANKTIGGAQADLGKDISKANITRGKEDVGTAIIYRNEIIQAQIDHIARVQTAKVAQAEKVGQAKKDLHIAGYTEAAGDAANILIANAQTEFNGKVKTSRITLAGDMGDADITAAESHAGSAGVQAGSWNSATEQYTTTSTGAATTWTTGTNTLAESYAQNVTSKGADWDIKVVKAYRDTLADAGTSDVSWVTTLSNADAARTGSQAAAQASWVTNQVQAGAGSLLWSGGDSTSTNASGTWVTQYAPVRTAKIVATSIIDAARQVASWFDSKEEANKQANADVKFVEDVKDPTTQAATSLTQHEGTASASATTSSNDLSKDIDSSERRIRMAVVGIESTRAIDEAKARKKKEVALAGLAEGASTTEVDKAYQDDMAKALFEWQKGYANLTYTEGSEQLKVVTETITEFGQAGKKYIEDAAGAEKTYTDALAPIIGTRTVSYIQAGIDLLKASTGADNTWRNNTAQAWENHTGGDLTARGNAQRGVANASSLLADASRASIAEHKAQWWQTEIPNYLQWSTDVGAIETAYTDDTTDNILQRAIGVKNAGVKYATDVAVSIKDYDVATVGASEEYVRTLMTIAKSIGDTLLKAERDKEIALADAELQKQLTGNESDYAAAVQAANTAHTNTTTAAVASRKSQEQTALSTVNSKLSNERKDKEADIAAAKREYNQTVASLDSQYGSVSSNGDTGVEGATRRSAIKTRDAQYYAARDTSWANTLSGSTTLGTSPWSVKAISAANAQAAYSTSRATAQAVHDAAMLDAMEDWQLSSRESLTDLLFTEGQSRETFNVATANVYANWENGVGNLLGDKPEGTDWEGANREEYSNQYETTGSESTYLDPLRTTDGGDSRCNDESSIDLSSGLAPLLPQSCSLATSAPSRSTPIIVINPTEDELDDAFEALVNEAILAERIVSQQRQANDSMQRIEFATGLSAEEIAGKTMGELRLHATFRALGEAALHERVAMRQFIASAWAFGLKTAFDINRNGDDLRAAGARANGSDWDPWIDAVAEYTDGIEQIQMNVKTLGWSDYLGATNTDQFQGWGWEYSKIGFQVGRDFAIAAATFGTGNLIVAGESGLLIRSIFTAGQAYEGYNTMNSSYHAIDQYSQGNLGTGTLYVALAGLSGGTFATSIARPGIVSLKNVPKGGTQVVYTVQEDIGKIWSSQRVWGQTEGAVYGMRIPNAPRWRTMIDTPKRDPGRIIFKGDAAKLFKPHEVWGPFSGMKRLFGQQKAGFGDVVFDQAFRNGNQIIVTGAHLEKHAGQSTVWAVTRLWGRRSLDVGLDGVIIVGVGAGVVYVVNQ